MKQAVSSWIQALETDFFHAGKHVLVPRWDGYLDVDDDYVELRDIPSGTHVTCPTVVVMQLLASECAVLYSWHFDIFVFC